MNLKGNHCGHVLLVEKLRLKDSETNLHQIGEALRRESSIQGSSALFRLSIDDPTQLSSFFQLSDHPNEHHKMC